MPNAPDTPGKDLELIKPNIPDCWGVQPTKEVPANA